LLGPVGGILIADYYFIRRQQLSLTDLYDTDGIYRFAGGFNRKAIGCLILGILPNIPGFLATIGAIHADRFPAWIIGLYNYAWFVGFFVAGGSYWLLMRTYTINKSLPYVTAD
jgi:NCS1 family nucleobase:cation symporter-1